MNTFDFGPFGKWGPGKPNAEPAGDSAEGGWKVRRKDTAVAVRRETRSGDTVAQTGVSADLGGNVTAGSRTASKRDDKGKVVEGSAGNASVGKDGVNLSVAGTRGGENTGVGVQTNPLSGKTAVKVSHGNEKRSGSLGVSHDDGTTAVSVGGKRGPVSVKLGASLTDKVTRGELGHSGLDATMRDFVGDGTYLEHKTGSSLSGGGDAEYGPFGVGGSAYTARQQKRRHFKAGGAAKDASDSPVGLPGFPGVPDEELQELDKIKSIADVDLATLARGEGYAIERGNQVGGEGHVKLGLTIGLGTDDAEMSQTVLARDASGALRVMVAEGDEESLTGSISAGDLVSASAKESTAKMASVSFTAEGPEGEEAVKAFQRTGLLPGADRVALRAAPEATARFQAAKKAWEDAVAASKTATGYAAVVLKAGLDGLQAEMRSAASDVNGAFLNHRGGSLDDAKVAGVRYDEHTVTKQAKEGFDVSVAGFDLLHGGSSETEWDKQYRAGDESRLEQGYEREDEYVFAKNETSTVVMDPKGMAKGEDEVAMVMGGKQAMDQRERDVLAQLGGNAFDMPAETLEAWRDGSMNEAQLASIAVTVTESQLAKMRDTIARPSDFHADRISGSAGALWKQVERGADWQTAMRAAHGDDDAERDVARRKELLTLYEAAAEARAKQIIDSGEVNPALLLGGGMSVMLEAVDNVKTTEDFLALTPEEQKLVVATGAIGMRTQHQSPFECMRLVLQVKDKNQRNDLMRQLFATNERRDDGADSAVDFVEWVQMSGEVNDIPAEEIQGLLSGAAVRFEDPDQKQADTDKRFRNAFGGGKGNQSLGRQLAEGPDFQSLLLPEVDPHMDEHIRQRSEEKAADRITDLLGAARGTGQDSAAVEQAVAAAIKEDPDFLKRMWRTLDRDPARAAWANHMLEGTSYQRAPAGADKSKPDAGKADAGKADQGKADQRTADQGKADKDDRTSFLPW